VKLILLLSVLILSGCGGAVAYDHMKASDDLMESKTAYKNCIKKNPSNCAVEKELYSSDLETLRVFRGDVVTIRE